MLRQPNRSLCRRWIGVVLLLIFGGMAVYLAGNLFCPREPEEDAIPNDVFAVQGREDDGTVEDIMLKIVCLTFDDGPSSNTGPILDILQEKDVPATFFVTAQEVNQDYLPELERVVEEGHQVALHSASHRYSEIYADTESFWLDIKALRQAISPYVDVEAIHWLRFPGGSTNTISHKYGGSDIMKRLVAQCGEKGYEWIDWNVSAEDATSSHPDAGQILENIRAGAEGRDLCVVLMHDTAKTDATVEALPEIIDWFAAQGYHFCTVEQMYEARDGG